MKGLNKWLAAPRLAAVLALLAPFAPVAFRLAPPALVALLCGALLLVGLPFKPCESWLKTAEACNAQSL